MAKIGYLIPEFPGQTHAFFWRERQALRRHGVDAELVSTRRPPPQIVAHGWSEAAMAETEYLFPIRPADVPDLVGGHVRVRGQALSLIVASIRRAEGLDVKERLKLLALLAISGRLAGLAKRRGWRHLHAHSCGDAANIAMFAHFLCGIPYSITLHGPLGDYGPNQHEKWRHAAFAVVITRQLLEAVRGELGASLPAAVEVAPMGVDTEKFRRRTPFEPWSGAGPLRIFSCGRLNPCKGHLDLIRAVSLLRERGLDARLAIAGEDEAGGTTYRKVLETERDRVGLGEQVELLGAISEERVQSELERAHVFALASLAEPLGVAIMEAMALEMPVVVTGQGGVPELVDHAVDGILVPAADPAALATAIERVARDPELSVRLGRAARTKIETQFHAGRSAELLAGRINALP
jgi:colanic acid/amylovoran biosynthesis glycosyltransferase